MNGGIRSIGVVDDHPLIGDAIRSILDQQSDLRLAWAVHAPSQARSSLDTSPIDLLIMEVVYPQESGLEFVSQFISEHPNLRVLIYSSVHELMVAERCLRGGAKGFIMKTCGSETLLTAIRRVLEGGIYLSDSMSDRLLGRLHPNGHSPTSELDQLSDCEAQVFQLIGRGMSASQIAASLNRSRKTIETFLLRIRRKLGLHGSRELAQLAMGQWIEDPKSKQTANVATELQAQSSNTCIESLQ